MAKSIPTYEDERLVSVTNYNNDDVIESITFYNSKGNPSFEKNYDDEGALVDVKYFSDSGVVYQKDYNEHGEVESVSSLYQYTNDSGIDVNRLTMYREDGSKESIVEYGYDHQGDRWKRTEGFDENGRTSYTEVYHEGTEFDTPEKKVFTYDESGEVFRVETFRGDDLVSTRDFGTSEDDTEKPSYEFEITDDNVFVPGEGEKRMITEKPTTSPEDMIKAFNIVDRALNPKGDVSKEEYEEAKTILETALENRDQHNIVVNGLMQRVEPVVKELVAENPEMEKLASEFKEDNITLNEFLDEVKEAVDKNIVNLESGSDIERQSVSNTDKENKKENDVEHKNKSNDVDYGPKVDDLDSKIETRKSQISHSKNTVDRFFELRKTYNAYKGGIEIDGKVPNAFNVASSFTKLLSSDIIETAVIELVRLFIPSSDKVDNDTQVEHRNENGKIEKIDRIGADGKIETSEHFSKNGKVDFIEHFDKEGFKDKVDAFKTNGDLNRTTTFDRDGNVEKTTIYGKDNIPDVVIKYNEDGTKDVDKFDTDGKLVESYKVDPAPADVEKELDKIEKPETQPDNIEKNNPIESEKPEKDDVNSKENRDNVDKSNDNRNDVANGDTEKKDDDKTDNNENDNIDKGEENPESETESISSQEDEQIEIDEILNEIAADEKKGDAAIEEVYDSNDVDAESRTSGEATNNEVDNENVDFDANVKSEHVEESSKDEDKESLLDSLKDDIKGKIDDIFEFINDPIDFIEDKIDAKLDAINNLIDSLSGVESWNDIKEVFLDAISDSITEKFSMCFEDCAAAKDKITDILDSFLNGIENLFGPETAVEAGQVCVELAADVGFPEDYFDNLDIESHIESTEPVEINLDSISLSDGEVVDLTTGEPIEAVSPELSGDISDITNDVANGIELDNALNDFDNTPDVDFTDEDFNIDIDTSDLSNRFEANVDNGIRVDDSSAVSATDTGEGFEEAADAVAALL